MDVLILVKDIVVFTTNDDIQEMMINLVSSMTSIVIMIFKLSQSSSENVHKVGLKEIPP